MAAADGHDERGPDRTTGGDVPSGGMTGESPAAHRTQRERVAAGVAERSAGGAGRHRAQGRGHRLGLHWPHRHRKGDPGTAVAADATYSRSGQLVPTGLGASLATSGGMLLAMVEDVRMRGGVEPEDIRPLADTFARHSAAKEATVRKVLLRHDIASNVVARDRQEGDLIQGILDRALTGRHPEDTRTLTVDGALTQMYQYLSHERRDLVPAIDSAVSPEESESLAAAFDAISYA